MGNAGSRNRHYAELRDLLAKVAGLDAGLLDRPAVERQIDDRIRRHALSGPAAYLDLLHESPAELERLVEGIAVPETWLFRYPDSFRFLARILAKRRQEPSVGAALRMLSVGCATGEEPASMAIAAAYAGWRPADVVIDAIEQSSRLVAKAQRGTFAMRSLRPDVPFWARRWLQVVEDHVRIDPAVAGMVRYIHGDILTGCKQLAMTGAGRNATRSQAVTRSDRCGDVAPVYDIIFCRNVLIYLASGAGAGLVTELSERLVPAGLLFVGHAELWLASSDTLVPVTQPHVFALRRAVQRLTCAPERVAPLKGPSWRSSGPAPEPKWAVADTPESVARAVGARTDAARTVPATATLAEARVLADTGRLQEAFEVTESILATGGAQVEALALLGSVNLAMQRLEEARDCLRKVVYLQPGHEEALLQLSLISARLGNTGQAARYRQQAERAHQK